MPPRCQRQHFRTTCHFHRFPRSRLHRQLGSSSRRPRQVTLNCDHSAHLVDYHASNLGVPWPALARRGPVEHADLDQIFQGYTVDITLEPCGLCTMRRSAMFNQDAKVGPMFTPEFSCDYEGASNHHQHLRTQRTVANICPGKRE